MTDRTNSALSFNAQIHGVELKIPKKQPKQTLDKKQEDLINRYIAKTQENISGENNGR